jgi:hypothetical protein
LPFFQQEYEVNRVAFTALKISIALKDDLIFIGSTDKRFSESTIFLQEFQEKLVDKIHKAIEGAKDKAKRLPAKRARQVSIKYWEQAVINCPVCGNLAILNGSTEKITWTRRGNEEINEPSAPSMDIFG